MPAGKMYDNLTHTLADTTNTGSCPTLQAEINTTLCLLGDVFCLQLQFAVFHMMSSLRLSDFVACMFAFMLCDVVSV